jgi:Flp pilus assembly protein TadD
LRQRVKAKPEDPLLQYLLGETLIRSGANPGDAVFTEAKNAFEHSIKLNPKFAPSQVQLGKLKLREGRVDEAIALLEEARSLDPTDKAAYSQLAIAYRREGKSAMATGMLTELAKLNDEERAANSHSRQRIVRADTATKDPSP